MKALLIAIAGLALIGASVYLLQDTKKGIPTEVSDSFQEWKEDYNKSYADPDTEVYRLEVYYHNYQKIEKHNKLNKQYSLGANQFMDLTQTEFAQTYLTLKTGVSNGDVHEISGNELGDINWVDKGAVTPIKDQGQCGSCWAFSTVGGLEGISYIFGGKLQSYSEQMLVDCSSSYGNMGCNGGLMDYAFEYVIDNGICTESDYPYKAVDQNCKADSCTAQKFVGSYTDVPSGNCDALLDALQTQPISIGVDAETWQFYSGGVFDDCGTSLDHGVVLVGSTSTYYLVKNSWGTSWGMKGYIELAPGNTCGICDTASYPNYKKSGWLGGN